MEQVGPLASQHDREYKLLGDAERSHGQCDYVISVCSIALHESIVETAALTQCSPKLGDIVTYTRFRSVSRVNNDFHATDYSHAAVVRRADQFHEAFLYRGCAS
jgi:hypothetical protein